MKHPSVCSGKNAALGKITTTFKFRAPKNIRDLRNYNMRWQGTIGRKATGGKLIPARGKRKYEVGREQSDTTIAEVRVKKIETVKDNKANLHYMRRNILTKGAVIKTELGDARITNRPGQDGVINAILLPAQ